jgi:hypothetical protein
MAAVRAVGFVSTRVRRRVLDMLGIFFLCLPPHLYPAATAVLIAGNVVEATADLMESDDGTSDAGVAMLTIFYKDAQGRERMCAQGVVDPLLRWISKWLLKV